MESRGKKPGEKGLTIRRPKKERYLFCGALLFTVVAMIAEMVHYLSNDHAFWEYAVLVSIAVFYTLFGLWWVWEEAVRQTFFVNEKGITNIRYGKPRKHFNWDSFVAIEKHICFLNYRYGPELYEAIVCSTHPIKLKTKGYSEPYLDWDYHVEWKNRATVVELVLKPDQYAEFLSYIPEEIKESGIVKV